MMYFEEFHTKLVLAISKFMEICEKLDKDYWYYDRFNLRYAIERELYFSFIGEIDYFYNAYINRLSIKPMRTFKSNIYKLIIGGNVEIKLLEDICTNHKVIKNYCYNPTNKVLISVISLKFLKYIEPVLSNLDSPFFLLCMNKTPELDSYLKTKDYNYIYFDDKNLNSDIPVKFDGLLSAKLLVPLLNILFEITPSVIINMEGCHVSDQLLCELGNALRIKTICLQHGYAPDYANTFQNFSYQFFLTWGDYFSDGFKEYNQRTNFIAVGNHIVGNQIKNIENIKVIAFFLQAVKYFITQKDFDDFIRLIMQIAIENPFTKILVREHPSNPQALSNQNKQKLKMYDNITFVNFENYSLFDVLSQSDLAVSYSSSTLVEAIAVGCIPLYINSFNLTMFDRLINTIDVPMVSDINDANVLIQKLLSNNSFAKEVQTKISTKQKYFFSNTKKNAIQNIIHCVEDSL